ncbi:hypothetical protein ACWCPQ_06325 [Nocardia sp. NPDC001965]
MTIENADQDASHADAAICTTPIATVDANRPNRAPAARKQRGTGDHYPHGQGNRNGQGNRTGEAAATVPYGAMPPNQFATLSVASTLAVIAGLLTDWDSY